MLYGRRLDQALEHVDGSRYALVHAVAKRARQITLWLTADPAELRAEAAPPPAPGELATRDPVALAEAEILQGEVVVRWDPDGLVEEIDEIEAPIEADPLLLDGLDDEEIELGTVVASDEDEEEEEEEGASGDEVAGPEAAADVASDEDDAGDEDERGVSLEAVAEEEHEASEAADAEDEMT